MKQLSYLLPISGRHSSSEPIPLTFEPPVPSAAGVRIPSAGSPPFLSHGGERASAFPTPGGPILALSPVAAPDIRRRLPHCGVSPPAAAQSPVSTKTDRTTGQDTAPCEPVFSDTEKRKSRRFQTPIPHIQNNRRIQSPRPGNLPRETRSPHPAGDRRDTVQRFSRRDVSRRFRSEDFSPPNI